MNLQVKQSSLFKGLVLLPASKSYSIRAFIIAACGGRSTIVRPSNCDDAKVAMRIAEVLGARLIRKGVNIWQVVPGHKDTCPGRINVKESGTALRFLLPLLSLKNREVTVVGEGTLKGRPNFFLTDVLRRQGVVIRGHGHNESIPIKIKGGKFKGGRINIDGTLSSQFISALLIACPLLDRDTRLIIEGDKIVSADYITMTGQVLKKAGIKVRQPSAREFHVKAKQKYKGLNKFVVPSDYGLAAFLIAGAVLTLSDIRLEGNLKDDFVQADGHILGLLKKMGAVINKANSLIKIKGPQPLKGGEFSLKDCPDLVPVMAVLALFAGERTRLYDIGHARAKESDRISDLRLELLKVGAEIDERPSELIIYPQKEYKSGCVLDPHHDHRLAMAFSVLGLRVGAEVKDIECVNKSYPDFIRDFKSLGAKVKKK